MTILTINNIFPQFFLDIRKAFDSVSHVKLIKKLEHYGIRRVAKSLFESYLHDRKQFVSITNTNSSDKIIEYGVPEGSILGPLLFLAYINDLPSCLQTTPRFFADDTALLITGKTTYDVANLANIELTNVSQWMRANGLLINTTKTEALLITPVVRKTSLLFTLMFNSQTIIRTESANYLGITIDDQLSFKKHIALLENKIARSVGVIAKLSYYLPSVSLVNIFYSLVHSHFIVCFTCVGLNLLNSISYQVKATTK